MSGEDATVKFGASTGDLLAGINQVKSSIESIGDHTSGLVSSFMSVGATIASAFAIDKLLDFASAVGDVAEELQRTAEITGIAADEILGFQSAVKLSGGSADSATAALTVLERNMSKAASGSKEAKQALLDAGISMKTIQSGDASKALEEMADKFHASADGAGKVEVAYNAAGRGGKELIPVLNQGSEALKKQKEASIESNSALLKNGETFDEVSDNIMRMRGAATNLWNTLYAALAPALNAAVIAFTAWSKELTKSSEEGNLLIDILHGIGVAFTGIVLAIDAVKTAVEVIFDILVGGFEWVMTKCMDVGEGIVTFYKGVGKAIKLALSGDFKAAGEEIVAAQASAMDKVKEKHQLVTDDIKARWDEAQKHVQDFMDRSAKVIGAAEAPNKGITSEGPKGPPMKSTRVVDTEKDNANLLSKERAGYQDTYDLLKQFDEMKVESGRMSNEEMYNDLSAALDRTHALMMESFAEEDKLYADDKVKHAQLIADKAKEENKYISQKLKLDQQMEKDSKKNWDAAFGAIENSFNQMLTGVLRGTQTMEQAFKNMAGNLVISMIEACAKMALQWIKKEAMQTAATLSGNATRTSADLAASATSGIANKAAASSQIMMDAKESAANVYADVSAIPYVGWLLAPPAAATAFAAVAAYNSFEQGADFIPTNMTANIHEGERIVPKADNKKLIDAVEGGGGAGGGVHLHINAMDSRDVKRFLSKHKGEVSKTMQSWARGGGRTSFAT